MPNLQGSISNRPSFKADFSTVCYLVPTRGKRTCQYHLQLDLSANNYRPIINRVAKDVTQHQGHVRIGSGAREALNLLWRNQTESTDLHSSFIYKLWGAALKRVAPRKFVPKVAQYTGKVIPLTFKVYNSYL